MLSVYVGSAAIYMNFVRNGYNVVRGRGEGIFFRGCGSQFAD